MGSPNAKDRAKYAVVRVKGPASAQKYPIRPGNKQDARDALSRIGQAKPPLTAAQKAAVRARANLVLGR